MPEKEHQKIASLLLLSRLALEFFLTLIKIFLVLQTRVPTCLPLQVEFENKQSQVKSEIVRHK